MSTDILRSTLSDLVDKKNNGKTVKNPWRRRMRVEGNRGRTRPKNKLMDVIGEGMRADGVNENDRLRDRVKGEKYGQLEPPLHFV